MIKNIPLKQVKDSQNGFYKGGNTLSIEKRISNLKALKKCITTNESKIIKA